MRNRKFHKIKKKLKNTITTSFLAKIGWKMMRKRENKNYRSVPFRSIPTRCIMENSKKIAKKLKKKKKKPLFRHFKPKYVENAKKEKK